MPKIRSSAEIAGKWQKVTPQRTDEYKSGVENPREDWATNTAAAETRYNEGVQAAIAQKRFGSGVKKTGTKGWQDKTAKVGPGRWAEGVREGGDAYAEGFEPFRKTIENTVLPQKYAKGDPRNIQRVAAIADALHKKKIGK
uniref:Uncharacterized protein n=1 Tax=viral metagenome TaxID=1070528 RepID=A0A6H1ZVI7_9ZZZZ